MNFSPGFMNWLKSLGLPKKPAIVIFRGKVFEVEVLDDTLTTKKFCGFIGTSSTFAVINGIPRAVKVIKEPEIKYNRIKKPGVFVLK